MIAGLAAGTKLYKYKLIRKIGGGHFGEVWIAWDDTVGREVAVKILDESMASVATTLEEARVGNRLNHKNVLKIHYADVVSHGAGKLVMIAMDLQAKGSVQSLLNAEEFVASPKAIAITIDVLKGLEYLHEQTILHNDIKPSNILLGNDGNFLLTDYGISCMCTGGSAVQAPTSYILHRAPETAATGTISFSSDIYQVGMTLFRLSNGAGILDQRRKTLGDAKFNALKATGNMPSDNDFADFVDLRIKRVIQKAIAPAPGDRYQTALEMRRALERIPVQGFWDVDPNGRYVGTSGQNRYSYKEDRHGQAHSLTAFKENIRTGRKTRVTAHCHASLTASDLTKLKRKFIRAVVKGRP
jgi:serine/threonine protein kinase